MNELQALNARLNAACERQVAKEVRLARIAGVKDYLTWGHGKRCPTKDLVDFPDLKDDERCPNCEAWERFDDWLREQGEGKEK